MFTAIAATTTTTSVASTSLAGGDVEVRREAHSPYPEV